jgi:putative nucleotidyltransferase with HDIG domain
VFGALTASSLVIGWLLSRHFTKPLSRLVGVAKAVAQGDLTARSNLTSTDEIGTLATTFDAMTERLQRQHLATIAALASAIDARDPSTAGHSVRVGDLSAALGTEVGLPSASLYHLRVGGILHDIGKIGIRDNILLKPGRLTAKERAAIQAHPRIGLTILAAAELPPEVLAIVGGHHERLNGTGYPLNLTAEELSVFPRIAAVADVYDAVTTDRPYRAAMNPEEALRLLRKEAAAGLLDPDIVAAMVRLSGWWEEHRAEFAAAAGDAGTITAAVA